MKNSTTVVLDFWHNHHLVPMSLIPHFPLAPKLLTAAVGSMAPGEFDLIIPFVIGILLLVLVIIAICTVSIWILFKKAGKPGWAAFMPFYHTAVLLEITSEPLWWIIMFQLPLVNIVYSVLVMRRLAGVFGKGVGFTWGLVLFPYIFLPILAFGKSTYANTYPQSRPMSEATKWALVGLGAAVLIAIMFQQPTSDTGKTPALRVYPDESAATYATDGQRVYRNDRVLEGVDPKTVVIAGDYVLDGDLVFYGGKSIADADARTFVHVKDPLDSSDETYYKDATHVYDDGVLIPGADPATFVDLGNGYTKDAAHVYYQNYHSISDDV
jgi:hypothetical protein